MRILGTYLLMVFAICFGFGTQDTVLLVFHIPNFSLFHIPTLVNVTLISSTFNNFYINLNLKVQQHTSQILTFSSNNQSRNVSNLPPCIYDVQSYEINFTNSDLKASIFGPSFHKYGSFSFCQPGVMGILDLPPSRLFPIGILYIIEPLENIHSSSKLNHHFFTAQFSSIHKLSNLTIHNSNQLHTNWTEILTTRLKLENVNKKFELNKFLKNNLQINYNNMIENEIKNVERSKRTISNTLNSSIIDPVRISYRPGQQEPYVVELYLIVDEILAGEFRGHYDRLIYRVNMIMGIVNALFAPFNIVIVVVRLEIWEQDRSRLNVEEHHLLTTLAQFKRMHATVRHDCLHALLGIKDQGSRMRGKANHMTMCVFSRCVGYSRDSPTLDVTETARTMAHEIGHNFGLRHDTEECECQGCIMATGIEFGTTIMQWSPCSIRDLPGLLEHGMGVCLRDLPSRGHVTISSISTNVKQSKYLNNTESSSSNSKKYSASSLTTIPSIVHIYDWRNKPSPVYASQLSSKRSSSSLSPLVYSSSSSWGSSASFVNSNGLCGNGQLDPGEECDCGTKTSCPEEWQECCDVVRCRLRANAECAGGPCCSIEKTDRVLGNNKTESQTVCRFKPSGTICRSESSTCDLPEYCDGQSQWCPADVYKIDGELCYTEDRQISHCVRGGCRNADNWCRVLWGKTAQKASASCFYENIGQDIEHPVDLISNCGVKRPPPQDRWEDVKLWSGIPCRTWQDTQCGRLWCHHQNEKAMLLGWIQSQTHLLSSSSLSCSALVYDPVWPASDPFTWDSNGRLQINPNGAGYGLFAANTQDAGMVPDGTPCDRGLCYNGSCQTVDEVQLKLKCNCHGHGVCNNLGHCHCLPGFKPPNCDYGGNGGSLDSGPPPERFDDHTLLVAICVLFFILLPIIGFMIYWFLIRKGKCAMSSSEQYIYTSSGLQKPFDEQCAFLQCFSSCCRRTSTSSTKHEKSTRFEISYPTLVYQYEDNGTGYSKPVKEQSNGHCGTITNGILSNGVQHTNHLKKSTKYDKPEKATNRPSIQRNSFKSDFNSYQTKPAKSQTTNQSSKIRKSDSHFNKPQALNAERNPLINKIADKINFYENNLMNPHNKIEELPKQNDKHNTFVISEPHLETMTYQGNMCSLSEAYKLNTIKHNKQSHQQLPMQSKYQQQKQQSSLTENKLDYLNNDINSNTIKRSKISTSDISTPYLQTTTYNENLTDLATMRKKMSSNNDVTSKL